MNKLKPWIQAFRLRTLPLAFSSILLGSFLAGNKLQLLVLVLALNTTLFLQILSNLANDFGDFETGVDNSERVGPTRAMQSGAIKKGQMKVALVLFSLLSLVAGITLITIALPNIGWVFFLFLLIGIAAIAAAIKYTMGKKPYGYMGLGDFFVFLFFGLVGVLGTYFLHTQQFNLAMILPATSVGLFAAGVLNLNNLRDVKNDGESGKNTLVVKIGFNNGKIYHYTILIIAILFPIIFNIIFNLPVQYYAFLVLSPIWIKQMLFVKKCYDPATLNPELKKLAISTLLFALLYGIPFIL
jgi:1,4-dihydroxy-2-naphthoate octaprenyltransferase